MVFCAIFIAEHIDGRRELQALAAGVFEATEDGVSWGVGNGPIRANFGVGGRRSRFGSKNRGITVMGVGVPSWDVESSVMAPRECFGGVRVAGDAKLKFAEASVGSFTFDSGMGTLSSSGVRSGMMLFQLDTGMLKAWPGDGG